MSYITDMFARANLQQICGFLLYGAEYVQVSDKSYEERINEADKQIISIIREKFPKDDEAENIIDSIMNCCGTFEKTYMEIGFKCGIMISMELNKMT